MALFSGITNALGLTEDPGKAAGMAQYTPYNINASYGQTNYDPATRTFNSSLDPRMQQMQQSLFGQFDQYDPNAYLQMLRQQAAPYEQQQSLGLENRLFSQGRLEHSAVDQPGGARRSLFDSFANADLQRQLGANQWAQQGRSGLMDQMGWFNALENSMWNPLAQQGQIGASGQQMAGQLYGNQSQFNSSMTNTIFENIAGGIMGGMFG